MRKLNGKELLATAPGYVGDDITIADCKDFNRKALKAAHSFLIIRGRNTRPVTTCRLSSIRPAQITTRNCIRWNRTLATALRCFASWKPTEGRLGVQLVEGVGLVASGV